jgi:hypothetical protein
MTTINVSLPDELLAQAQQYVSDGWTADMNELLALALRRYLESRDSVIVEGFVREDIAWGLHGDD